MSVYSCFRRVFRASMQIDSTISRYRESIENGSFRSVAHRPFRRATSIINAFAAGTTTLRLSHELCIYMVLVKIHEEDDAAASINIRRHHDTYRPRRGVKLIKTGGRAASRAPKCR